MTAKGVSIDRSMIVGETDVEGDVDVKESLFLGDVEVDGSLNASGSRFDGDLTVKSGRGGLLSGGEGGMPNVNISDVVVGGGLHIHDHSTTVHGDVLMVNLGPEGDFPIHQVFAKFREENEAQVQATAVDTMIDRIRKMLEVPRINRNPTLLGDCYSMLAHLHRWRGNKSWCEQCGKQWSGTKKRCPECAVEWDGKRRMDDDLHHAFLAVQEHPVGLLCKAKYHVNKRWNYAKLEYNRDYEDEIHQIATAICRIPKGEPRGLSGTELDWVNEYREKTLNWLLESPRHRDWANRQLENT